MAQTRAYYGSDGTLSYRKLGLGLAEGTNLWADCPLLEWQHDPTIGIHIFDDFESYVTTQKGLTSVITDAGGTCAAAAGTHLVITSDSTDNDEAYVGQTTPMFTLASGKDIWFEAKVRLTEANVDDANIIVGLDSLYAADTLQDDGAGPPDSHSGVVFFKVDGGTVWQAEAGEATGGTETTLTSIAAFTSAQWYRLGIKITSNILATLYINSTTVGSFATTLPNTAFGPVFGVKAGGGNAEALYVDWYRYFQLR